MRLLFVEDNSRLAGLVEKGLSEAGFVVDALASVEDALAALATTRYSAAVLDLGLPDGDGMSILRSLRARGDAMPVLILTARDGLKDRVGGLNSGADDYLLKPFEMEELIARLRALLRRPGGVLGTTLVTGNVGLDTIGREVRIGERPAALSRRETGVLEQLMRRTGRVVPKTVLEEALYGFNESGSSNSVEVAVHRLRKKLASGGADVTVHTLTGIGYLLSEKPP